MGPSLPRDVASRLAPRFTGLEPLGRGGMGLVVRAREAATGREVAVKLLLDGASSVDRLARFQREAALTARVRHPGVVAIHAADAVDGLAYLVLELVPGARPLDVAWASAPLRRRVAWLRDAARALGAAHAVGVAHRDVKPGNLLVDAEGALRVTDFGLAAAADLEALTRTGAIVGTPAYMAPEQVDRRDGAPGATADVWALGVVLYEALTGRHPFEAPDLLALIGRILTAEPTPAREVEPTAPADLEAVCRRCLARRPVDRYPDGEALADDLDAWLDGRPLAVDPARPGRRPSRRALARGGAALALLGPALALLVGVGVNELRSRREDAAVVAEAERLLASTGPLASDAAAFAALRPGLHRVESRQGRDPLARRVEFEALAGLAALAAGNEAGAQTAAERVRRAGAGGERRGPPPAFAALLQAKLDRDPLRVGPTIRALEAEGAWRPELGAWFAEALLEAGHPLGVHDLEALARTPDVPLEVLAWAVTSASPEALGAARPTLGPLLDRIERAGPRVRLAVAARRLDDGLRARAAPARLLAAAIEVHAWSLAAGDARAPLPAAQAGRHAAPLTSHAADRDLVVDELARRALLDATSGAPPAAPRRASPGAAPSDAEGSRLLGALPRWSVCRGPDAPHGLTAALVLRAWARAAQEPDAWVAAVAELDEGLPPAPWLTEVLALAWFLAHDARDDGPASTGAPASYTAAAVRVVRRLEARAGDDPLAALARARIRTRSAHLSSTGQEPPERAAEAALAAALDARAGVLAWASLRELAFALAASGEGPGSPAWTRAWEAHARACALGAGDRIGDDPPLLDVLLALGAGDLEAARSRVEEGLAPRARRTHGGPSWRGVRTEGLLLDLRARLARPETAGDAFDLLRDLARRR